LQDYLRNRKQFVSFDNHESKQEKITCGVPQGSILGPLLFLLYVNDIVHVSQKLFPIIFADDTNIFLEGKEVSDVCNVMTRELEKVFVWLQTNKLTLNIMKTQYMCFRSSRAKIEDNHSIYINNTAIEYVDKSKFIGVTLDSCLCWGDHIKNVKSKVAKGLGIIGKARKVLDHSTLKILYHSLIYPHFTYGIEVWGNAATKYMSSLTKLQKRIVRMLVNAPFRAETNEIFKSLKLLKIPELYELCILMFMFKFVKRKLPTVANLLFKWNYEVNQRTTRNDNKLYVPICRTTLYHNSIKFQGVELYNKLVDNFNTNCALNTMKNTLKKLLWDRY